MPNNPSPSRHRSTKIGEVVSRSGNKSIVVKVSRRVQHPLYKRYVNYTRQFHAHDERNQCQVGDWVRIVESRPISRWKRWRLQEIIRRSPTAGLPGEPSESAETEERQP